MALCLVPDFPAVQIVLEHLSELETQLTEELVSFSPEAAHHLREIAEALKELEASRKATHEELEVETIETGKLRHQVLHQRDDIINEISAGVAAARDVSTTQLNQVQLEMKRAEQEIESMEKRQKALEEQTAALLTEQEFMKVKYDDVIERLNCQLSEKASMQIMLNELMNEIRSVKEKIAQVETFKKNLQEGMVHERETFAESKKTLEKEIKDVMSTIHEQKEANAKTQQMLEVVLAELLDKNEKAKKHSNQISQLDRSIDRLRTSELKYNEQLEEGIRKLDAIDTEKERLKRELEELRESFQQKIQTVQEKTAEVENEIEEGRKVTSHYLESIAEVQGCFSAQRKKEDEALAEHHSLSRQLERSKQRLEERMASIAKYKFEVKEMEKEMKELCENDIVNAELFRKNLDGLGGQLAKEKRSRATYEAERDELCQALETLKEQHEHHVRKLTSDIELMKMRYSDLQEEEKNLQDQTAMNSLIEHLTNSISTAQEESKQMEMKYHTEIQQLTRDAELIKEAHVGQEQALKLQEAVLEKVKAQFDIDHSRHQMLKKQTTELESRKNQLEALSQEIKQETEALIKPKEDLKTELQTLRHKHMESLSNQVAQISAMEKIIYEKVVMLEQVNMENSRLHLCIEQMKEDILTAQKEKKKHVQDTCWMKEEVPSLYRNLMEAWVTDKMATEESTQRDEKLLKAMQKLLFKIQERKHHVGDINNRVEQELTAMSTLLENTSTKTHNNKPQH